MAVILSLLVLASAQLPADRAASVPRHVSQPHDFLSAKEAPKVGVLSQGNFDSVHHLLPDKAQARIFSDKDDLIAHTRNSSVDASLISGLPADDTGLVTFSSTLVSVRAMFSAEPADTLRLALDAAIVRALHANADRNAAAKNPPFQFVAVHTCRTDEVERFPFPAPVDGDRLQQAIDRGYLRIAALGPYDWAHDGNYKTDPHTGFWPEFLSAVETHFREEYNVGFQRVWAAGSADTMNLILNGDADATEPYWTVDAYHDVDGTLTPRPHAFRFSCSTLGYDSTFMVADTQLQGEIAREAELESEVVELKREVEALRKETGGVEGGAPFVVLAGALVASLW
jgi:hypothetical protein